MTSELWTIGANLTTIAMWVIIIGVAVLVYTSRTPKDHSSRRTPKK